MHHIRPIVKSYTYNIGQKLITACLGQFVFQSQRLIPLKSEVQ